MGVCLHRLGYHLRRLLLLARFHPQRRQGAGSSPYVQWARELPVKLDCTLPAHKHSVFRQGSQRLQVQDIHPRAGPIQVLGLLL